MFEERVDGIKQSEDVAPLVSFNRIECSQFI